MSDGHDDMDTYYDGVDPHLDSVDLEGLFLEDMDPQDMRQEDMDQEDMDQEDMDQEEMLEDILEDMNLYAMDMDDDNLAHDFRSTREGFFLGPLGHIPAGPSSQHPSNPVQALNDTAEPWASLFQQGYREVLSTAFDKDVEATKGNTPMNKKDDFMRAGRSMLAAMSEETVMSIMDGTLAKFAHSNAVRPGVGHFVMEAAKEVRSQYRELTYQPMFYASYLVNNQGLPPTEFELTTIINFVENYARGDSPEFTERIDLAVAGCPDWLDHRRGDRRYMRIDEDDELMECLDFIHAVRQHLPEHPSMDGETRALGSFGVTNHAGWCFCHHARHEGGRSLMYLVDAVCASYFSDYRIRHYVVFKAFEPDHLWAGDILLNAIGKGDRDTGYGFGYLGRNPEYEETAMQCVYDVHFSMWQSNAIQQTPLRANLGTRIAQIQTRRHDAANTQSEEILNDSEKNQEDGEEARVLVSMLNGFNSKVA